MAKNTKNYTKTKLKCTSHRSAKGRNVKCSKKTHTRSFLDDIKSADIIQIKNNNLIASKLVTHKKPLKNLTQSEKQGLHRILQLTN